MPKQCVQGDPSSAWENEQHFHLLIGLIVFGGGVGTGFVCTNVSAVLSLKSYTVVARTRLLHEYDCLKPWWAGLVGLMLKITC